MFDKYRAIDFDIFELTEKVLFKMHSERLASTDEVPDWNASRERCITWDKKQFNALHELLTPLSLTASIKTLVIVIAESQIPVSYEVQHACSMSMSTLLRPGAS